MKAALRHPVPGETDLELVTLGASAGAAAWGCAWVGSGLPLPQCAFHALTGLPCPTCGATRCVLALMHGHVGAALAWNPMVFAGLAVLALVNLYAAVAVTMRLPRLRIWPGRLEGRWLRVGCILLVMANWAYEIHHGV